MESRDSNTFISPIIKLKKLTEQYKSTGKSPPIILDSDGGIDPDDFNILCSGLLDSRAIDVRAIVTVGEFVDIKAKIFKYILNQIGRSDIPVFTGKGIHFEEICQKYDFEYKENSIAELTKKLDKRIQEKILTDHSPTYPAEKFGDKFCMTQGLAWKYHQYKPDGNFEDAKALILKTTQEHKEIILVSTGELSNVAAYYKEKLSSKLIVMHMGGWSAVDKSSIFPRKFMGRNTIADLEASEIVFNDPNANVILCMSQLRQQYNLEFTGDLRGLLSLVDEVPLTHLSKKRAVNFLMNFHSFNPDTLKEMKKEEIISQLKSFLSKLGINELPHANELGKSIARDFANWQAYTGFTYLIIADPMTMLLAIEPDLIASAEMVNIEINAKKAFKNKEKFMCSLFTETIKTTPGGRIAAITELQGKDNLSAREYIMKKIISGLLRHIYPGVTYEVFKSITNAESDSLLEKNHRLNKICKESKPVHHHTFLKDSRTGIIDNVNTEPKLSY